MVNNIVHFNLKQTISDWINQYANTEAAVVIQLYEYKQINQYRATFSTTLLYNLLKCTTVCLFFTVY